MNTVSVQVVLMKEMAQMTVKQLKQLLDSCDDDHKIRVWVEMKTDGEGIRLEGRKLCGVLDEDDLCCLCAMLYEPGEAHR